MSTPKVRISQDDATGLVTVEAQWAFNPHVLGYEYLTRKDRAEFAAGPMLQELATLLAMSEGEEP